MYKLIEVKSNLGVRTEVHQYGDVTLTVGKRRGGLAASQFELNFGEEQLDFLGLPATEPARRRNGIDLSVLIYESGFYSLCYDPESHSIKFDPSDFRKNTFPLGAIEEFCHARTFERVNTELQTIELHQGADDLPQALREIWLQAKRYIVGHAPEVARIAADPENYRVDDPGAAKAWNIAHELVTELETMRTLETLCGGDIERLGMTRREVAEAALLYKVNKAESVEEMPLWGSELLDLPLGEPSPKIRRLIRDRLAHLEWGDVEDQGPVSLLPKTNVDEYYRRF